MDYEKAYKAVLKTATQWIKDGCTDKEKICLECVFPELRESEDERIRKTIVATIEQCPDDFLNPKNRDKMLAYLERQKVTPMPNSTELIEMWHKVKAILKEKDFRGDEWRLAQNAFMDGFARGTCVKLEKQKEQKPAEWSEEDEKKIHFLSRLIEFQVKDGEYCFGEGACAISKQEAIEMLQSIRPQPKQEWSEEEEGLISLTIAAVEDFYDKSNPIRSKIINFLKSLRPSWKPSEGQGDALVFAIKAFRERTPIRDNLLSLYNDLKKL